MYRAPSRVFAPLDDRSGRTPRTTDELVRELYRRTVAEFEAHFIQWVHWPSLDELDQVRQVIGVLDRFCLLQAYRGQLEKLFTDVATCRLEPSPRTMLELLEVFPAEAERRLADLRLSKASLRWFTDRWAHDVNQILLDLDRSIVENARPALNAAIHWTAVHPVLEQARRRTSAGIEK